MSTYALIYNRVSSDKQAKEGHGLESQNQRGKTFAVSKDYIYEKSFFDEGISGAKSDRPAIKLLLDYIDTHTSKKLVVIIDDISRLARDVKVYLQLKTELTRRGVQIESPNFNFEDSPEGFFIENIMAAKAQLDREQNARQVKQKMKARLELGYWCFRSPPLGLTYKKDPIHGKILTPVSPYSLIYKEVIESYEKGLCNTLEEVRQMIEIKYKENEITRTTSISGAQAILSELLYTGYMEYPKWNIERMKGKHEGFIDIDTFNRVQQKLKGKSYIMTRKDYSLDFPLRTLVLCDECKKTYTGGNVHGRSKQYPKYWCKNKNCLFYTKSVPRDTIEEQFKVVLEHSKPDSGVIDLTENVLLNAWENKADNYVANRERIEARIEEIDKQITAFSDQIALKMATNDQEMIRIYEGQIKKLTIEMETLKSSLKKPLYTTEQFRTASDKVLNILREPVAMWESDEYKDKTTIFAMYFDEKLRYNLKEGFRTATLALPVALMKDLETQKEPLVEMPGIEPGSGETP